MSGTDTPEPSSYPAAIRLYPPPSHEVRVEDIHADLDLPTHGNEPDLPYVILNMVCSLDGKVAMDGRSAGIGDEADRRVMRNVRSNVDAILRGANTLRAERIAAGVPEPLSRRRASRGLEPQPAEVLLTKSGRVPLDNLLGASPDNTLVLVPDSENLAKTRKPGIITAPATPEGNLDMREVLKALRGRSFLRILSEGGPTLNHALLSENLAHELFLTISPKLLGGSRSSTPNLLEGPPLKPPVRAALISTHLVGSQLFLRYSLRQQPFNPSSFR